MLHDSQTNITMTNTVTMTTVIRQNHTNELYMLHDARWDLRKSMSDILLSFAGTKRSKYYNTHLQFHWNTLTRITQYWCTYTKLTELNLAIYCRIGAIHKSRTDVLRRCIQLLPTISSWHLRILKPGIGKTFLNQF